jgi:hypothetical protein
VEHSFDVVAFRVERERSVVAAAVLRVHAGRPVVGAAVVDRRRMPSLDADGIRRPERDVCAPVVTRSRPGSVPTACSAKSSLVPRPNRTYASPSNSPSPSTANPSSASAASYMRRLVARSLTLCRRDRLPHSCVSAPSVHERTVARGAVGDAGRTNAERSPDTPARLGCGGRLSAPPGRTDTLLAQIELLHPGDVAMQDLTPRTKR